MKSNFYQSDLHSLAKVHTSLTQGASKASHEPGVKAHSNHAAPTSAHGFTPLRPAGPLAGEETAHAIHKAMTARTFRREHPRSLDGFLKQITAAVSREVPVPFLLYWGKGDRDAVSEAEQKALGLLNVLKERIQSVYPGGSQFTIILTDTHALLNGYPVDGIRDYQNSLQSLVQTQGMTLVPMSQIAEIDIENLIREAQNVTIDSVLFPMLLDMCRKHFHRGQDFEGGAKMYFLANQREKSFVGEKYPGHVFLTYNASSLDALLPDALPIFHMYSIKRGISAKPWFI